ncbi:MAG: ABC transporter permease subunit, partial [Candidatus Eremiobacteraeota bacterium]|nr:ABC transporter permease subunit [Candidatus Eremiobacteraeota bacterium]
MKQRRAALGLATVAALLVAWEVLARAAHSIYVPPVTTIAATFAHEWFSPQFVQQAVPSLIRMFSGYLLAAALGVGTGVLIGAYRPLYRTVDPVLQFLRAIPPTALIPVGILLIGIGDAMKILVIALGAFWPILVNAADGARGVDRERLDTARIFGLSPLAT